MADQLSKITRVARAMGLDTRRDTAAIAVCFTYLIALVEGMCDGLIRSANTEDREIYLRMLDMQEAEMRPYISDLYPRLQRLA